MPFPVIERTEARTEDVAIVCEQQDRGDDRKPIVVARQDLNVPVNLSMIEFENMDEIHDLRNILNEMIELEDNAG